MQNNDAQEFNRRRLIHILQMAYSGEKSAALAYQGHAGAVSDTQDKLKIKAIEQDEWDHRQHVGEMLASLNAHPHPGREILQVMIGRVIKPMCYVSGWFFPMLGAWLLEEANIQEYHKAALHADALGLTEMTAHLRDMADRELQHALFFKERTLSGQSPLSSLAKSFLST